VLQTFYLCESDKVSFEISVFALWGKWVAMPHYIWLYGRKRKYCPRQVQAWAFKTKVTPVVSSYIVI